jgi:PAS domain S-box-containing protein
MDVLSVESRVETLINAVKKASPTDEFLGIDRTGADDALDRLVEEIDALLARFGERMKAFQSAQEALLKLQIRGDEEADTLSREHRLLLDALKENVPDKIYFKDAQGRFLHFSNARVKAFDLISTREIVGMTDFDLFTEDHARTAFEDEQRIIRTGEPIINKEEKETWRDQPSTWVLTTKMPLRDEQGAIVGTFGISRNITERKRAEERYQLLFNCIDDAVLVHGLTPDGRPDTITEVNDIACEKLGYTRSELLRMNPLDLLPPETAATAIDMMVRLKSEKRTVWESSYVTRTGLQVPVEISSHLFDVSGEQAVLSAFRDIARRKQLEENLEREKALLMTLIDNLPDHVSVKDAESRFLITNASNALVMGLVRPQDAIGKTDFDFYPAEEAARYMADERNLMQTGTPLINKEEESKDPGGRTRFTLTSKVPLRNARGEVVGVVCTGRDITERKEAELALHQEAIRRRIFFEEAADGIVVIGEGLTVVDANRSFASMLGYPSEEIRSLRAWDWDALYPTEESFRKQWPSRPPPQRERSRCIASAGILPNASRRMSEFKTLPGLPTRALTPSCASRWTGRFSTRTRPANPFWDPGRERRKEACRQSTSLSFSRPGSGMRNGRSRHRRRAMRSSSRSHPFAVADISTCTEETLRRRSPLQRSSCRRRRWRQSGGSPGGLPTISTTS